jgi:dTDP-4-dehydro-6-deoxy-alpha-D-glucopyranose 2,3-dehydratase
MRSMPHRADKEGVHASVPVSGARVTGLNDVYAWLEEAKQRTPMSVEFVALNALDKWEIKGRPLRLVHATGSFFSVAGIRVMIDYNPVKRWDQPIIDQPDVGILGILTQKRAGIRHYLMQAKTEPGNVNGPQISPTLAATSSNYKRMHKGRSPLYLEYFTGERPTRVLVDQLQSEQAARFFRKRNRNVIIETEDEVPIAEGFRWMTLVELQRLTRIDNLVNTYTRSVLSCAPFPVPRPAPNAGDDLAASLAISADPSAPAVNTQQGIIDWIARLSTTYRREIVEIGLDRMEDWVFEENGIHHRADRHFSIVGARSEIPGREVGAWSQPINRPRGLGLIGLIMQKINGVLHALLHADLHPGSRELFELGPTVARSNWESDYRSADTHPFLDLFRDPRPGAVRFSAVHSDEGGRFFQSQNRHVIVEMPDDFIHVLPEGFIWLTLGQIRALLPGGLFNIESRSVFSCLPIPYDDAKS